jgi:hypothetical protein
MLMTALQQQQQQRNILLDSYSSKMDPTAMPALCQSHHQQRLAPLLLLANQLSQR